jgi:hypothetical protein
MSVVKMKLPLISFHGPVKAARTSQSSNLFLTTLTTHAERRATIAHLHAPSSGAHAFEGFMTGQGRIVIGKLTAFL